MKMVVGMLVAFGIAQAPALAAEFIVPTPPADGVAAVTNANPVEPGQWPATFIFRNPNGGCTSTAVGPNVIITAAHCVGNGETGTITLAGGPVAVTCDHHPGYAKGNPSTDFALCHTAQPFTGFAFENISASLANARPGSSVSLLGFGCTKTGGFDRSFGVLHLGTAIVMRGPFGDDIDTVTSGDSALCYGDSGGGAYFISRERTNTRVLIGINSRGDLNKLSFISSTATPVFVEWALAWAASKSAPICGLNPTAKGCRP